MQDSKVVKPELLPFLAGMLEDNTTGLSEFEILRRVRDRFYHGESYTGDQLLLFKRHFEIYNALYHLQLEYLYKQLGDIQISPLLICIEPYRLGQFGLVYFDKLRSYYLDANNYYRITIEEVNDLMAGFWKKIDLLDEKANALQTLELQEPTDLSVIKQQYKKLCLQHHPDRGGSTEAFQAITHAMRVLTRYYE
jgi:hypothetical protein